MADKPEIDEHSGVETTGHEWDGIKELNNPLPRWWLWIFYATIVWAIVYMVFMPAIPLPGGATRGLRNHSERANVEADLEGLAAQRASYFEQLENADLGQVAGDEELFRFAYAAGQSAFGDNCATCHGAGAQGFPGYPNLNDDVWLWGGTIEDIEHTITVGVRSSHPDTRRGGMTAFGRDDILSRAQITDVMNHVLMISGQEYDAEAAARGATVFADQCAVCHGDDGRGDRSQGAPDLTDEVWLFGSDPDTIRETVTNGRMGEMPTWEGRLDPAMIDALTVYVHSLGGGEPS